MIKSIAGKDVGFGNDVVVRWDDATKTIQNKWHVRDRRVYVKKCKRPEQIEGGIYRPEKSRMDSTTVLVLAVGDRVGLPLTKEERRKYDKILDNGRYADSIDIQPGQIWFAPDNHVREIIQLSPHEECDEYFINSLALIGKVEE